MKINKKGFVLAEAIVVAVFVVGLFTYIAVNILPLLTMYETVSKYDNPNEIYAINVLYDELKGQERNLALGTPGYLGYVYDFTVDDNKVECVYYYKKNFSHICNLWFPTRSRVIISKYMEELIGRNLNIKSLLIFKYTGPNSLPYINESNGERRAFQMYFNYEEQRGSFRIGDVVIIARFNNDNFSYIVTDLPDPRID